MDCPSCGHTVAEAAKFCSECGAKQTPAGPAQPEGERRQLTVMFCDLVGSTELASRMDAEDFRDLVGRFQEAAGRSIERYDGRIGTYLGDGLLVYFGYPQAHEDDAERAVRAGLDIVRAIHGLSQELKGEQNVQLAVRLGIHTGPVVLSEMGSGDRRETQALGATLNVAARLEGVAEPDSVVVSDATLRLVPGMFLVKSLGTPELKGVAEPIEAHAVLQSTGVRSRLAVDPARLTPFVGRSDSISSLLGAWEKVCEGSGQAVLVSGEAGVGKSRVVYALRDRLAAEAHRWFDCHGTPFTQGSAFHPLIELVERALALEADAKADRKLAALERALEDAGMAPTEAMPLIAPLLQLPLPDRYPPHQGSPAHVRALTIETMVTWLQSLAQRQALVLLVEDLHWCDASTLEVLGLLIEKNTNSKILLLLTHRPVFASPWSDGHANVNRVTLDRLDPDDAEMLVASVPASDRLTASTRTAIVDRADGLPLHLEELTKAIIEQGNAVEEGNALEIPTSIQASLMSRLDRLKLGKRVAQMGAVLGREFPGALLEAVSELTPSDLDAGLSELQEAELLFRRGRASSTTYFFKHALVRDAAYDSLLRSSRRKIHEATAQALFRRFPERVEREPEFVAQHCDEGGLPDQAISHYRRAGERAFQAWANAEAIAHLGRAIELLGATPESEERDRREIGLQLALAAPLTAARGWTDPDAVGAYERAKTLADGVGEIPELPRVLLGVARPRITGGDLSERTVELCRAALAAAERSRDSLYILSAHQLLGCVLSFRGEFAAARDHLQHAVTLYDSKTHAPRAYLVGYDQGPVAWMYYAMALGQLGFLDQLLDAAHKAVEVAREGMNPFGFMMASLGIGFARGFRGEFAPMRECGEGLIAFCEQYNLPGQRGWGLAFRGWARCELGEIDEGVADLEEMTELHRQLGLTINFSGFRRTLAICLRKAGRLDDAWKSANEGLEFAQTSHQHHQISLIHHLLGEIALDRGAEHIDDATRHLIRALETARRQGAKGFELRAATSLARLWHSQGKTDEARDLLAPVYDWFTEGFDTQDLKDAKTLLEELA